MRRLLVVLALMALVAGACTSGGGGEQGSPSGSSPPAATGGPTTSPPPNELPGGSPFGTLADVSLLVDTPRYQGPATPHSLGGVAIASALKRQLSPNAVSLLEGNGFAVVPSDLTLFMQAYEGAVYDRVPVYVTTDVAYNTWHLVFDKILRDLEQTVLLPKLEDLVTGLLDAARTQSQELAGTPLEDAARRVEELMQTAAALLELDTGSLSPPVQAELALIRAHAEMAFSPILVGAQGSCSAGEPGCVDYSLFAVRGHYTRTEELSRYFLGMSLLGQMPFCVGCKVPDVLRVGILASRLLAGDDRLTQLWRDIYEPTAFLVGLADDYTPVELANSVARLFPSGLTDPSVFAQDSNVLKVAEDLMKTRPVRIDPESSSVRLMGTRFVIDSYILDQLIFPNVGTPAEPRLMPSALDLAAVFGSDFAYGIQKQAGETKYAHYDEQMSKMRDEVAARTTTDWGSTVYDAWLWSIQPMWAPHGRAFPDYMRTEAWTTKDQQSGLGSYAELKHDTILYTKQASSEGEGPTLDKTIRNWVEPDPAPFSRLASVTALMREGLSSRGLSTHDQDGLMAEAVKLFEHLARIATDELAGKPLGDADNEWLAFIGGTFDAFWQRTADVAKGGYSSMDHDAAIVADIASSSGSALEVATGRIDWILVLVPDGNGGFEIARGGVYSYYEFTQPISNRLTDEQWRQMLKQGKAPERPSWEGTILAG